MKLARKNSGLFLTVDHSQRSFRVVMEWTMCTQLACNSSTGNAVDRAMIEEFTLYHVNRRDVR